MRPKRRTPRNRVRQRRTLPTLVSCKGGPGEVKTPPSKPSAAKEKAPKKGSQTKDRDKRARQGHMSPSQCQWAQQEVEGQRQKEGAAEGQRPTAKPNLGVSTENSVTKGKNAAIQGPYRGHCPGGWGGAKSQGHCSS